MSLSSFSLPSHPLSVPVSCSFGCAGPPVLHHVSPWPVTSYLWKSSINLFTPTAVLIALPFLPAAHSLPFLPRRCPGFELAGVRLWIPWTDTVLAVCAVRSWPAVSRTWLSSLNTFLCLSLWLCLPELLLLHPQPTCRNRF